MATRTRTSDNGVAPKPIYRTITPADAKKMIERSKRPNRPLNSSKVKQYAAKMKAGLWDKFNSQAVTIDVNGDIVNGHHRLQACIEADTPFETLFAEGVPPETFANEDSGLARSSANYLHILGEKNSIILAAAARVLRLWDMGLWSYATSSSRNVPVSNEELLDEISERPVLRKAAAYFAAAGKRIRPLPLGMMSGLWALTSGHPKHEPFWNEMVNGTDIAPDSPVRLFRDRIAAMKAGEKTIKKIHLLALVTKTWNAYADGKRVVSLAWRKGADERFPEPITKLKPRLLPPEEAAAEKKAKEEDARLERRKEILAKATVLQ